MAGLSEQVREMFSGQMQVLGNLLTKPPRVCRRMRAALRGLLQAMDSAMNLEQIRTLIAQSHDEIGGGAPA